MLKIETSKGNILQSRFLLYLPQGYDTLDRSWPLLLFLHGSGERGELLELVKRNGPPKQIEEGRQFPFIVVSPQCPEDQRWETQIGVLDMLLQQMVEKYRVDTRRLYVTGLSMGGQGTWNLAFAYPDRFAAIVPICGWADPGRARLIRHLPAWVFHGAKDDVVPLEESQKMVDALKAHGSPVKFTIYPEAGHDAWTEAYESEEMWEWLLEQKKGH
ncbi:MAG: prolyl oligopeptidase family serine peptidase [Bacteroidales bacterium]